jgi:dTDP-4-dehydrorhamnose 3,5-epimerase-like enzyme
MQFIPTSIPDVVTIEPKVWADSRGYFFESYSHDLFQQHIGKIDLAQALLSDKDKDKAQPLLKDAQVFA